MLLASAGALLAVPSTLLAQNPTQADTVETSLPTQLPRTAIPHHYAITVTPHASARTVRGASIAQIAGTIQAIERGEPIAGVVGRERGY